MSKKPDNHSCLTRFKTKYSLDDEMCVAIVVGYADEVDAYLTTPSLPGKLPPKFLDFLQRVDEAFSADDNVDMPPADKPALPNIKTAKIMDDIVVEADIKTSVVSAPKRESGITHLEAEYELDDEVRSKSQLIGHPMPNVETMQTLWEGVFPVDQGYAVKLSVKTASKVFVLAELIDSDNKTCCRLKPRHDSLTGVYDFHWKSLRVKLTLL